MRVLNNAFGHPMPAEETAVMPLAGGIMQHGYQCGMVWGSSIAAGRQAYHLFGPGPRAEAAAILASRKVVETFRDRNKHVNCTDITGIDKSSTSFQMTVYFLFKGGTIDCMRMAVGYASAACRDIEAVLTEQRIDAPSSPVSCSAVLAQKMGLSDLHRTMAAGLAGGIGLSGGGCGALGAAIWAAGMDRFAENTGKLDFDDPKLAKVIGRFGKCTGFEFECSKIVGRRFADCSDHADYVRGGGCANIIETLAAR